jgi:hypothetical protein
MGRPLITESRRRWSIVESERLWLSLALTGNGHPILFDSEIGARYNRTGLGIT